MRVTRIFLLSFGMLALLSCVCLAEDCHETHPGHPCGGKDCNFDFSKSAIDNINIDRATENPPLPPLILPPSYSQAVPGQKVIMVLNAERKSRGYWTVNSDVNGVETNDNDRLLEIVAYNHSRLVANIPELWSVVNLDGNPGTHNNAVDGDVSGRAASLPGFNNNGSTFGVPGEAMAGAPDAERAIWGLLYSDSGSNWGHRDGLLSSCAARIMGVGVAPGVVTIDGIMNDKNNYPRIATGTPIRRLPVKVVETDDREITVTIGPYFQNEQPFPNYPKWVYLWKQPPQWGKPTDRPLGRLPVGSGAEPCKLGSPVQSGDGTVTVTCTALAHDNIPLDVTVTDRYSDTQFIDHCFSGQPPRPGRQCYYHD